MPETTPNYSPAILGTSIAVLWLINTGLSIGSSKQYDNYISRFIKFFNKKPIILPSLIGNALRVRDSFARAYFFHSRNIRNSESLIALPISSPHPPY